MVNGHCAKKMYLRLSQIALYKRQLVQYTKTLVNVAHTLYLRQYLK